MKNKVLFLNGNLRNEFYNNERNKYKNITATNIFINNSLVVKVLRKFIVKCKLPILHILFGNWKKQLDDYNVFILSVSIYNNEIAKYINKKKIDKKIIHWYWNPVSDSIMPYYIKNDEHEELWSFDKEDCQKFNMKYLHTYYFGKIKLPIHAIVNDIYFVGADKRRLSDLLKLKKNFEDKGLKAEFHIIKSSNSVGKYKFQPRISYEEVLKGISKSKAILDLVQIGQSGMSQRPMESIFFKKKLITNDMNICNNDFYCKDNIFIIGIDDFRNIVQFVNSPYIDIDFNIIKKYDFENWLKSISQ